MADSVLSKFVCCPSSGFAERLSMPRRLLALVMRGLEATFTESGLTARLAPVKVGPY